MPTTTNIHLKILFSIFLLSAFFSCETKKQEKTVSHKSPGEITSISVSHIGGILGDYRIIKATQDSVFAEKGTTASQTHKEWRSAISHDTWKSLIFSINTEDLDDIKSSPSQQSVDGIDETFQIRTPKKSHIYVNSFADTAHYRQLQLFKEQLDKILPKEYKEYQ
ncbi:hypothetical protein V2E39_10790 [Chryseobacterium arthrosphaerae]|uniref:Uncharacterized protein n=1 Tax=Chryseobacterium arthrosphaerae TaxID=651561 RepID=A0A1B8ZUA2_9FLAO|nr:hypothetical protein [Chryseobacterium arthrosphaerae]AYZ13595.1 hypothetical protein EGY05_17335 [Chryseobacterium arthrosphaerae]MDG4653095.1 hypothetical protein [Chryseobacterium arthrosphaerae]OCA75161.1 hypothetical protein BBI00_12825 [Chryseobacterium arthrosphaerae]RTZ49808.1 hypothetical protein EJ377_06085 [Chryseobacterium arthrosphaerae]UEQ78898.1 hypothetical protein J8N07_11540 [Chryseobacterium arthrosphaerae]